MQKLPSCPYKRNHFTQSTFIHHLSMRKPFFFWACYSSFSHSHYSKEYFEWFTSHRLDSIFAHKWQLGSCIPDRIWKGCIWFVMDITYKCCVNYCYCRCHCFFSPYTCKDIYFFFPGLYIWIWFSQDQVSKKLPNLYILYFQKYSFRIFSTKMHTFYFYFEQR